MATAAPSKNARERAAHLGPERRRPMILEVAFELFLERGYKGTSMDAIADAAGVSKPVVYSCFEGKSELFLALLDDEEQRMLQQLADTVAVGARRASGEDLEATLSAAFTALLLAVIKTPEPYRLALAGGGSVDAPVEARVRRGREAQVVTIEPLARVWLEGRIPAAELDRTAHFVAQTLVSIGEAGIRTILASPQQWSAQTLGSALGALAAGGYATLTRGEPRP